MSRRTPKATPPVEPVAVKEEVSSVVVTVVIARPSQPDGEVSVNHSVLVNGRPVEGVSLGLVLTGEVTANVTAGIKDTDQMRAIAGAAARLADTQRDAVIGLLLSRVTKADEPPPDILKEVEPDAPPPALSA